jgi:hypothetical protein
MRRTWKVAMRYLAAAAALLALTPAHADAPKLSPYAEWVKHLFPPAQYDKPFPGRVIENRAIDMEDMAGLCDPHPQAGKLLGCSLHFVNPRTGEPRVCYIYIAPDWYLAKFGLDASQVRRHEIGHCNGWSHKQPVVSTLSPYAEWVVG